MRGKKLRTNFRKKRSFNPNDKGEFFTKEGIFVSRMASILMISKRDIIPLFSQRARTAIRLNYLKGNVNDTYNKLISKGYELEEIKWAKDVYFVNNKDKAEVSQTDEYRDGLFYIQNLSSILATLVLDPKPKEKILDMCAAPGSKSTHIAQVTDNKAEILANEVEISRTNSLRNVVEQFGASSVKVTLSDGRDFGKKYPDYFDKVLLDAPCSGEGMIYMRGMKPLRFWSIKKVKAMSNMQKELIESAFRTLKSGGTLVYSTCTLEPEENEGVVTSLLERHKNAKVVDINIHEDLKRHITPGITHWSGNSYDTETKKSIRVLPSPEMMGFYIIKIIKT
jgi:NOL1/NOP2/sun family putative RNA methylase